MPMPHRLTLALAVMLPLLTAHRASAQTAAALPDRWQLTMNDQQYIWDVRLVKLVGDTLVVQSRDSLIGAPIARIAELRLLPETILLVGDGHHSAISAMAGNNPGVFDLAPLAVADRKARIQAILDHYAHS